MELFHLGGNLLAGDCPSDHSVVCHPGDRHRGVTFGINQENLWNLKSYDNQVHCHLQGVCILWLHHLYREVSVQESDPLLALVSEEDSGGEEDSEGVQETDCHI